MEKTLHMFFSCFYYPLGVFLLSLTSGFFGVYRAFPEVDIIFHLMGGASIAYSSVLILRTFKNKITIKKRIFEVFVIFSFVCTAAVLWEFVEFSFDYILSTGFQLGLFDVIGDLFFGLVGGLIVAVFRKV